MATNLCLTVSNPIVEAETDTVLMIYLALSKTYMEAKQWLAKKNTDKELLRQDLKEQQSVTNGIELASLSSCHQYRVSEQQNRSLLYG